MKYEYTIKPPPLEYQGEDITKHNINEVAKAFHNEGWELLGFIPFKGIICRRKKQ